MDTQSKLTFYYAPRTRATGVLILLEELGVEYDIEVMNLKAGDHKKPAYLAINPMGKVPAIAHRGSVITEQVAIYIYLPDCFPAAGLSPALDAPERGTYLRWIGFYGSCFEPAIVDRAMGRPPAQASTSPYGTFDETWASITDQLSKAPYLLGDQPSAADVLWGTALAWTSQFKLVPDSPVVGDYIARMNQRDAFIAAREKDATFAQRIDQQNAD